MVLRACSFIVLGILLVVPSVAGPETGTDAASMYVKGKALLSGGDLPGAFRCFLAASKSDPENSDYAQQALVLRRVLTLRKQVSTADPSVRWERAIVSLHVYYLRHGLVDLAIELDREAHDRGPRATTASLLAEALLEGKRDAEAATLLRDLPEAQRSLQNRLYYGIALARTGRLDEARAVRAALEVDEQAGPGIRFDLARLTTLLGDHEGAVRLLVRCFESVPPSQLTSVKDMAKTCADLFPIHGTDAFKRALETKSKIAESGCSGGSGCGSCPSRDSGCGGSTEKRDGEKEGCGGSRDGDR